MTKRNKIVVLIAAILAIGISSWNMFPALPQAYSSLITNIEQSLRIRGGNLRFQTQNYGGLYGNESIITVPNPGQQQTLTIPDSGSSTANFLLDKGATGALTAQHVTVPLTAANIIAMYTTPVLLIAAPGAGKNIVVNNILFTMTTTATAFTGGGAVDFQLGNTTQGGGTLTSATVASSVITAAAGTSYTMVPNAAYTSTANTGLYISNATAAFAAGTGTAIVDIWYTIK